MHNDINKYKGKNMRVICPYCGDDAKMVDGLFIYPHRDDLAHKRFWLCAPCAAWVGCHPNTGKHLGRLANAELRRAKQSALAVFDPIWKKREMSRKDAYVWLSGALGIPNEQCHIGMFDTAMCNEVIRVCKLRSAVCGM